MEIDGQPDFVRERSDQPRSAAIFSSVGNQCSAWESPNRAIVTLESRVPNLQSAGTRVCRMSA